MIILFSPDIDIYLTLTAAAADRLISPRCHITPLIFDCRHIRCQLRHFSRRFSPLLTPPRDFSAAIAYTLFFAAIFQAAITPPLLMPISPLIIATPIFRR
jgi:hypothetical protein